MTIDRLASMGKRFNVTAAKADLQVIASDIRTLLAAADLGNPAVTEDMASLAKKSDQIYALFANAK